jgi:hypothetical protein
LNLIIDRLPDEVIQGKKPNNSGDNFLKLANTITVTKHIPKDVFVAILNRLKEYHSFTHVY